MARPPSDCTGVGMDVRTAGGLEQGMRLGGTQVTLRWPGQLTEPSLPSGVWRAGQGAGPRRTAAPGAGMELLLPAHGPGGEAGGRPTAAPGTT